ncbi:MAG: GNAT family N-acetyltransferase [Pseudomonadota bacterium]
MTTSFEIYNNADFPEVSALWARINRELAPSDMREQFERYIENSINDELARADEAYPQANGSALWVVKQAETIMGTFGIQRITDTDVELRRMYLDGQYRGQGLSRKMLEHAEEHARQQGFHRMILSTAELQAAAVKFYDKSGYELTKIETASAMSNKTVGNNVRRRHYQKILNPTG